MLKKIKTYFKRKKKISKKVKIQKEIINFLNENDEEIAFISCNNNRTYLDKLMFDYNNENVRDGISLRYDLKRHSLRILKMKYYTQQHT